MPASSEKPKPGRKELRKPKPRSSSRVWAFFFGIYAVLRYHFHRIPLILEAALTLLWARLLTWFFPFRSFRPLLNQTELEGRPIEGERVVEIAWAVSRLARFFPRIMNCLPQALTVQTMLRRRGSEAQMRFGVKATPSGALKAHAWIEWNDDIVIGRLPDLHEYARLPSWPATKASE